MFYKLHEQYFVEWKNDGRKPDKDSISEKTPSLCPETSTKNAVPSGGPFVLSLTFCRPPLYILIVLTQMAEWYNWCYWSAQPQVKLSFWTLLFNADLWFFPFTMKTVAKLLIAEFCCFKNSDKECFAPFTFIIRGPVNLNLDKAFFCENCYCFRLTQASYGGNKCRRWAVSLEKSASHSSSSGYFYPFSWHDEYFIMQENFFNSPAGPCMPACWGLCIF